MNAFKAACFAIAIVAVLVGFLVYPFLPNRVPTHWNAAGEIDGYGSKATGAFIFPLIMLFVLLLFILVPKIAVFKKNLKAFEKQYWTLCLTLQLFFLLFYVMTLLPNFGYGFDFSQIITLPLAMLFIGIGILMPSFKRNFFVGIRTPWSLANDTVWKKTHGFGGKLFILAGLAMLFSLPFPKAAIWVVLAGALIAAFAAVVYSFIEFRKNERVRL